MRRRPAASSQRFQRRSARPRNRKARTLDGAFLTVRVFVDGAKAYAFDDRLRSDGLRGVRDRSGRRGTLRRARRVCRPARRGDGRRPATRISELFDADVERRDRRSEARRRARAGALGARGRCAHRQLAAVRTRATRARRPRSRIRAAFAVRTAARAFRVVPAPIARDGERKRIAALRHGRAQLCASSRRSRPSRAAQRGARSNRSARASRRRCACPVIFERDVAGAVLDDIFSAVSAAQRRGRQLVSDRQIGERIGSELVTIVDDGRLRAGLGSSPFDGEGVPTRRTRSSLSAASCARSSTIRTTRANSVRAAPGTRPAAASARTTSTSSPAADRSTS